MCFCDGKLCYGALTVIVYQHDGPPVMTQGWRLLLKHLRAIEGDLLRLQLVSKGQLKLLVSLIPARRFAQSQAGTVSAAHRASEGAPTKSPVDAPLEVPGPAGNACDVDKQVPTRPLCITQELETSGAAKMAGL